MCLRCGVANIKWRHVCKGGFLEVRDKQCRLEGLYIHPVLEEGCASLTAITGIVVRPTGRAPRWLLIPQWQAFHGLEAQGGPRHR